MIDNYLQNDKELYHFLINLVHNNKVSHAYLIEENDRNGFLFAKSLAKLFLCDNHDLYSDDCNECNTCSLIDSENYPELLIIEPDGINIRKEQLIELQSKFAMAPIYGKKHICIIKESNKLNNASANSILKFLEEPNSPVIIILIANNRHQVINTIVSRCQIITLKPQNDIDLLENIGIDRTVIKSHIDIIKSFELFYSEVLIKCDVYSLKDDINLFLNIWLNFYMNALNLKKNKDILKNSEYYEEINYVCSRLELDDIIKRIDVILSFIKYGEFNVNKDLFIDNFFISLEKGECIND